MAPRAGTQERKVSIRKDRTQGLDPPRGFWFIFYVLCVGFILSPGEGEQGADTLRFATVSSNTRRGSSAGSVQPGNKPGDECRFGLLRATCSFPC